MKEELQVHPEMLFSLRDVLCFENLLTLCFYFFTATRGQIVLKVGSLQDEDGAQYTSIFIYFWSFRPTLLPAVVTSRGAFVHTYKSFPRTAMPYLTVLLFLSLKYEQITTRIPIYVRLDFVISHLFYHHEVGK